ncbi:MAG: CaiB/BaiF CoA-transferase family protein [Candidatus Nanopelagicales bacterium]|nr:CaiB/BaiF CoA-transferase family protein [Candidatus Nanopelagicales bacterium]
MSGPLSGVRILDLSWGVAGPLGVLMLAEQGADVIKVEPPGGDPFRDAPGSPVWHRSRRSVVLDLKQEDGREAFLKLLETADVLVEAFSPGTMAALGLSYDDLAARFPRLVYASVPAYPEGHRYASRPGWDALVQARSGAQYEQPAWRPGPAHLHMQIPSMGACFLLAAGVLAALHARENTGRGQHVETSLYQGVLAYTTMIWQDVENLTAPDSLVMAKTYPPGVHQVSIYECANGEWMHAGVTVGREATCTMESILGIEDPDPARIMTDLAYRAEHGQRLRAAFITRDRAELVEQFFESGIGCDPILSPTQAFDYPQLRANNMIVEVDDPEFGSMQQYGPPAVLSRTPSEVSGPRPVTGQHSRTILAEVGYDDATLDRLAASGVI